MFFHIKGSHLKVASCLLLPTIQLIVGISNPSWVSLPFFIGSCAGLVDWSLTSNFLGLFRWYLYESLFFHVEYFCFSLFSVFFPQLAYHFVCLLLCLKVVEAFATLRRLQHYTALCVSAAYQVSRHVKMGSWFHRSI